MRCSTSFEFHCQRYARPRRYPPRSSSLNQPLHPTQKPHCQTLCWDLLEALGDCYLSQNLSVLGHFVLVKHSHFPVQCLTKSFSPCKGTSIENYERASLQNCLLAICKHYIQYNRSNEILLFKSFKPPEGRAATN